MPLRSLLGAWSALIGLDSDTVRRAQTVAPRLASGPRLGYEAGLMPPPQGDDFAGAARRYLIDSAVLLDRQRWDGALYLSGYVAECALKLLV